MPSYYSAGSRRPRDSANSLATDNNKTGTSNTNQQLSLEDAVNALLICFSSNSKAPDWIQISAKIYTVLKVWYSPEALRDHYFRYLKDCCCINNDNFSNSPNTKNNGADDETLIKELMTIKDSVPGEEKMKSLDGRFIAFQRTVELARRLKSEKKNPNNNTGSTFSSNGMGGGATANSNDDETVAMMLLTKVKKEENSGFEDNTNFSLKTNAKPTTTTTEQDQQLRIQVKIEPTIKLEDDSRSNNNNNTSMRTITVSVKNNNNLNQNNNSASSSIFAPTNTLVSIWNIPQTQDFLLEMLFLVQNLPDSAVFNLNVGPRVQASLHYSPIGKPYADVVYQPTSLQVIRDKINASFHSQQNHHNSKANAALLNNNNNSLQQQQQMRTLCQLYVELSKMIANCVLFNLPGGSYPAVARSFMRSIMVAWADHVAKADH